MSQLDKIIRLFPQDGCPPRPNAEVVKRICAIDRAVRVNRSKLEQTLAEAEDKNRDQWALGGNSSWSGFDYTPFARFPEYDGGGYRDLEILMEVHRSRYKIVEQIFADQDVTIVDGGIKNLDKSMVKLYRRFQNGRTIHCPDLTRLRLVAPGLASLDEAYLRLLQCMKGRGLIQVANFNHYSGAVRKYPTPYRGVLTVWCGFNKENPLHTIATEIQLITERVSDVTHIDHPFNVAQSLNYPDAQSRDYVYGLMRKASILDFWERFSE